MKNSISPQKSDISTIDLDSPVLIKVNSASSSQAYNSQNPIQELTLNQLENNQNKIYLSTSNFISSMFFSWISGFLKYGSKFQIRCQNLPKIPDNMRSKIQFDRMLTIFKQQHKNQNIGVALSKSIVKCYRKQLFMIFLFLFLFIAFSMYAPIMTDKIIGYAQQPKQNRQISKGLILFFSVLIIIFGKIIFQSHVYYLFGLLGFNLSNTLSLLIYEKSLKHPVICSKQFTSAQIINYSQIDAQRMTAMGFQLSALLFTPFQVLIGIWLMYDFIGISFVSGFAVIALTIFFTYVLRKVSIKINDQLLKAKDARMKITEEIFSIIKFIKINAFQKAFFKKLNQKRNEELKLNRKKQMIDAVTTFVYFLSSPLILCSTFGTYIWLGYQMTASQAFTTIMLFKILQYPIKMLPNAISQLLQIWSSIKRIEIFLNSEQIDNQKIISNHIAQKNSSYAIKIQNGNFSWGVQAQSKKQELIQKKKNLELKKSFRIIKQSKLSRKVTIDYCLEDSLLNDYQNQNIDSQYYNLKQQLNPQLKQSQFQVPKQQSSSQTKEDQALFNINLQIPKQKLTMIFGDIGSGKSALFLALLNEMNSKKNSVIQINGSIAYVSQKPWITTSTVKENILFHLPYFRKKFSQCIKYSCLKKDLEQFIHQQNTQIGQKGTNLSGGQKTRISLARALYSDKDIYLLDDIVSAVDVHVRQFLIKQMVLKYLANKTVVLNTHAVQYAQYADYIIIMKKGRIIKKGTFQQIVNSVQFQQLCVDELNVQQINQLEEFEQQLQKNNTNSKLQSSSVDNENNLQMQQSLISSGSTESQNQAFQNNYEENEKKQHQPLIVQEDHSKGKIESNVYKEYIHLNGGKYLVLSIFVFMILWVGLSTFSNIQMQKWCQNPQQSASHLLVYLLLSIFATIFIFLRTYTLVIGSYNFGSIVHKKIIKSLLYASIPKFYNRVPIGRIINRLTKDMRQVDETISSSLASFLVDAFSLLGNLFICIYASTPLTIIPMIFVGYFVIRLRRYYMKTQRECARLDGITSSPIVSGFLSTVSGLQTIRAYNKQNQFLQEQILKVDQNKRAKVTRAILQSWFSQRLSFITYFINMTAIGYCILGDNQNSSLTGLLLAYALTLGDDMISVTFSFSSFQTKFISVQRVNSYMKIQPEVGYIQYCKQWHTRQQGYNEVFTNGEIQFKQTQIRYRDDLPPVIKGVSFKIEKGQKIGIVGRTGAGKTTIIGSLLRIIDCFLGSIEIDGKDIKQYFLKDLRYSTTMIDQEPTLINSSFRQNLDPGNLSSDLQLLQACKQCGIYDSIMQRGGLEAIVKNQILSSGQKQLICICRAILKQSKVVLIDQATANIDQKTDQFIQQVIQTKFKNSTVLTIAHRLSTLQNSDKILVLEGGYILQWGTPAQLLLKQDGIYRNMKYMSKASQFLK